MNRGIGQSLRLSLHIQLTTNPDVSPPILYDHIRAHVYQRETSGLAAAPRLTFATSCLRGRQLGKEPPRCPRSFLSTVQPFASSPSASFSPSAARSSRRRTLFMKSVGWRSADERSATEGTGQLRRRTVHARRVVATKLDSSKRPRARRHRAANADV